MNYKRSCVLMLTLLMLLSTFGCNKEAAFENSNQDITAAEKSISNSYTSSDKDIVHEKNLFEASEWIYYQNSNDMYRLYKRNMDGSRSLKLMDSYVGSYCLAGEWIYYSNTDDNGSLYRIKTDGSNKEKLNNDQSSSINVSREWVYYVNSSDNNRIYKVKKDGTSRTKLGDDPAWNIYTSEGDWIYYTNTSENYCLYRIGMDGRERTKITNDASYNFCVLEDWIYYVKSETDTVNYLQIYKIKRDGTEKTHLKDGEPHEQFTDFAVLDDYIYYDTYNSDDALYRIGTDGTDPTRISTEGEHINSLSVSKNGILFNSTFYNLNICKMNLESEKETIIDKPPAYDKMHLAEWILYNDKDNDLGLKIDKKNVYAYNELTETVSGDIKISGDTAYFLIKSGDYSSLYKLGINNPEPEMIAEGKIVSFDIAGDIIYYSDSNDSTIYSIKTDGTGKKEICKKRADYFKINGEWIYLTFDSVGIYKMKVDGTDGHFLFSNVWSGNRFIISGDLIYYADDGGLSKIKTDGTENTKLFNIESGIGKILFLKNDRIYYETVLAEGPDYYGWISGLYSIKLDGTDKQTLLEGTINSWAVVNGTVYYNKIIRDINIIKTKLDGTDRQVLVPGLVWH